MDSSTSVRKSSPLFLVRKEIMLQTSVRTERRLYSAFEISICPASILEKSSTPLIMESRLLPAFPMFREQERILPTAPRHRFGSSSSCTVKVSRRIISFMPSTALIGVRISWDILARNSLFA